MDYSNRKKVVKHVLVTGIVGDTIGHAIKDLTGSERVLVYQKTARINKATFPRVDGVVGKPGDFSYAMLGTFNALRKRTKVSTQGICYEGLLFGGAAGAGVFAALEALSFEDTIRLSTEVQALFKIDSEDAQIFTFFVWLVNTLITEGYFRAEHIERAQTLRVIPPALGKALSLLSVYQFDRRYMTLRIAPEDLLTGLTPYERTLAKAVYYLFQSFSGWTTKPRFALDGVVVHDPNTIYDLLFVFSVVCVASEHNYLLYTKPLQEQSALAQKVVTLFDEHM